MNLAGRVAIVTGAASGIGRSCALRLAAAGATVALLDRDAKAGQALRAEIREGGANAAFYAVDVARAEEVRQAVDAVVEELGRLDVAINNAGVEGPTVPLIDQEDTALEQVLKVNLVGVFVCMKYELQHMLASGRGGAVVNACSIYGLHGQPRFSPYAASKHAVAGLTKTAALEYARRGIRVNAIAPGPIATALLDRCTSGNAARVLGNIPMRRLGNPAEVAEAAVWLCSDAASFVTGHILSVDGGMSAQAASTAD